MSVFTSSGGQQSTTIAGASSPLIANVSMVSASTEYSYSLPSGCKQFMIKLRGLDTLQVAYVSGDSSSLYIEVPRGCFYSESDLTLGVNTIYFQSPSANQTAEIISWV